MLLPLTLLFNLTIATKVKESKEKNLMTKMEIEPTLPDIEGLGVTSACMLTPSTFLPLAAATLLLRDVILAGSVDGTEDLAVTEAKKKRISMVNNTVTADAPGCIHYAESLCHADHSRSPAETWATTRHFCYFVYEWWYLNFFGFLNGEFFFENLPNPGSRIKNKI